MTQHDRPLKGAWGMTTLIFLFIRFLPVISIFEMRTLLPAAELPEEPAPPPRAGERHP